jgi:hypothetical protein
LPIGIEDGRGSARLSLQAMTGTRLALGKLLPRSASSGCAAPIAIDQIAKARASPVR